MDYLIIVIVVIAIVLTLLSKFYGLSMVFPTLLIILAILMSLLSNSLKERKDKKKLQNIEDKIKENKK